MIECLCSIDKNRDLESEWNALYKASGVDNLFLTFPWMRIWLNWFSEGDHVVLLNRSDGELHSLGVFQWKKKKAASISRNHSTWPNILSLPSASSQYGPFLEYFRETKKAAWISLQAAPGDEEFFQKLQNAADPHFHLIRHYPHCTRSVNIGDSFDAFLGALPKKVRSELKRKNKNLTKKLPDVSLISFEKPDDVDTVFQLLDHIEKDSWKKESGTAIICSEKEIGFYREIYCSDGDEIKGRTFFLMSGNEPIAYVLGVFFSRRFYALKTSYQNQFSALSPGQVLFFRLLEQFSHPGREVDVIELLGGDARWKREIGSNETSLCHIELLQKSMKSYLISFGWNRVLPYIGEIMRKHPKIAEKKDTLLEKARHLKQRLPRSSRLRNFHMWQ